MKTTEKQPNFEKSLDRLETIVQEMEGGNLSLDKMMKYFEEGTKLVTFCSEKLNEVERQIEILVKADGKTKLEPFDPPTDDTEKSDELADEDSSRI